MHVAIHYWPLNQALRQGPKHPVKGLAFSPSTLFMAVAEVRHSGPVDAFAAVSNPAGAEQNDPCSGETARTMSLYTPHGAGRHAAQGVCQRPRGGALKMAQPAGPQVAAHFSTTTVDLEDIAYSPDGATLAVWDSLMEYSVLLYSPDGELKSRHAPVCNPNLSETTQTVQPLFSLAAETRVGPWDLRRFSAYSNALGIKSVAWSPCGQLLAIGSFDQARSAAASLPLLAQEASRVCVLATGSAPAEQQNVGIVRGIQALAHCESACISRRVQGRRGGAQNLAAGSLSPDHRAEQ